MDQRFDNGLKHIERFHVGKCVKLSEQLSIWKRLGHGINGTYCLHADQRLGHGIEQHESVGTWKRLSRSEQYGLILHADQRLGHGIKKHKSVVIWKRLSLWKQYDLYNDEPYAHYVNQRLDNIIRQLDRLY